MGTYDINYCISCGKPFVWWSGHLDQRCIQCQEHHTPPRPKHLTQEAEKLALDLKIAVEALERIVMSAESPYGWEQQVARDALKKIRGG